MFDNLRDQANASSSQGGETFLGEDQSFDATPSRQSSQRLFLGMTAPQRLIIAIMLMVAICTLGTMCLLLTQRIGLP